MASLITRKSKRGGSPGHTIQYVDRNGDRRYLSIGRMPLKSARAFQSHIEHLITASITGAAPPDETSRWINGIGRALYDRLADPKHSLVQPREDADKSAPAVVTIADLIRRFNAARRGVKESTRLNWKQGHDSLVAYFGADRDIATITTGEAIGWRESQIGQVKEATIRKRTRMVNTLINWAIDHELVDRNPFKSKKIPATSIAGQQKPYVPRADADKVLGALPDHHWRVFFALGRYAGLRLPSEAMALRWEHVDLEAGRIRVQVPKLEHHAGKGERLIPIFAELRPYLLDAFELAAEDEERVVAIDDLTDTGMRKTVHRAITVAKLKPWRAAFHSLRASCETDLARQYPAHVVADWIGHDIRVAQKHYLQVTADDFMRAATVGAALSQPQRTAVTGDADREGASSARAIAPEGGGFAGSAGSCGSLLVTAADAGGVSSGRYRTRTTQENTGSSADVDAGAALGAALPLWLDACPLPLPPDARRRIAAIVAEQAASNASGRNS